MGQTRGQIKTTIRVNLADNGVTFYSENDLDDSMQDAYDDICCLTQCICKSIILSWKPNEIYLDFVRDYGVTDYLATIAIFNNQTNQWLRDDLNRRDLDRIRRDWELWTGSPQFWCSSDPHHIIVAPHYTGTNISGAFYSGAFSNSFYVGSSTVLGTFKLLYWANAPVLSTDSSTFLTASDVQNLFEFYVTGDLLEQAQEFTKAQEYWEKYYSSIEEYAKRVKTLNQSDLLLRV